MVQIGENVIPIEVKAEETGKELNIPAKCCSYMLPETYRTAFGIINADKIIVNFR